jgi:hypothetical protein
VVDQAAPDAAVHPFRRSRVVAAPAGREARTSAIIQQREPVAKTSLCLAVLAMAALAGCRSQYEGGGELRARRVALEREVEGLRQAV